MLPFPCFFICRILVRLGVLVPAVSVAGKKGLLRGGTR